MGDETRERWGRRGRGRGRAASEHLDEGVRMDRHRAIFEYSLSDAYCGHAVSLDRHRDHRT